MKSFTVSTALTTPARSITSVAHLPLWPLEKTAQRGGSGCPPPPAQNRGGAVLWEIANCNSAKRIAGWRKVTFPPSNRLQGVAALWRSLLLLCPGLEAKMGSVETCGWTIGRGARRGVLARSRGFYLAIPSLKNKQAWRGPQSPPSRLPSAGLGP